MSLLPKIPGTAFSRYLSQERNKELKKQGYHSAGVFDDVEKNAPEITDTKPNPDLHYELLQKLKAAIGPAAHNLNLVYRGTIDARQGGPLPYGEPEGSFYIVEYGGGIQQWVVKPGDIFVRFPQFASDWVCIAKEEPKWTAKDTEIAKQISQKHLDTLKADLRKMPTPKTKPAPGPQKRKVILEDDE